MRYFAKAPENNTKKGEFCSITGVSLILFCFNLLSGNGNIGVE
jgi:hypothetical protein